MRLIELTIIYIAAGSPFAAHQLISTRSLKRAVAELLLWPITAISLLFKKRGAAYALAVAEAAERLIASLHELCEPFMGARNSEEVARSVIVARDSIEKYVCLTICAREAQPGSEPYEHETELYRVAGRKGTDLETAVRCLHRRNHARLVEHQGRARTELLHALAELREPFAENFKKDSSQAFLKFYSQALEFFSLAEDEKAAVAASRLLEAERARMRTIEREVSVSTENSSEVESCKPHARHLAFTGRSQSSRV